MPEFLVLAPGASQWHYMHRLHTFLYSKKLWQTNFEALAWVIFAKNGQLEIDFLGPRRSVLVWKFCVQLNLVIFVIRNLSSHWAWWMRLSIQQSVFTSPWPLPGHQAKGTCSLSGLFPMPAQLWPRLGNWPTELFIKIGQAWGRGPGKRTWDLPVCIYFLSKAVLNRTRLLRTHLLQQELF